MKYSHVFFPGLFGHLVAAIPSKRDTVTKNESACACETAIVHTTIWGNGAPMVGVATAARAPLDENPAETKMRPAAASTRAYTVAQKPCRDHTDPKTPAAIQPAVMASSITPVFELIDTTCTPAPPPATATIPIVSIQQQPTTYTHTGETFTGVDLTVDLATGAPGACGEPMYATDFYVALAAPAWGLSTHDLQTGKATNKWCGQKIKIEYGGKSVGATIMDKCPGCAGHDIDLSEATWAAIGMTELTRVKGSWSVVN